MKTYQLDLSAGEVFALKHAIDIAMINGTQMFERYVAEAVNYSDLIDKISNAFFTQEPDLLERISE